MSPRRALVLKICLALVVILGIGGYFLQSYWTKQEMVRPVPKDEQTIFNDLDESVVWYRHINALSLTGISTREGYLQETLTKSALKSLRYSFDVARIQAGLFENTLTDQAAADTKEDIQGPTDPNKMTPEQMQTIIQHKANDLQMSLKELQTRMRTAKRADRDWYDAQIQKTNRELALVKLQSDLVGNIFNDTTTDTQTLSLETQIDNLAATIPELDTKKTTKTAATTTATPAATTTSTTTAPNPVAITQALVTGIPVNLTGATGDTASKEKETKGIVRLIRDLIGLLSQKQDMAELLTETQKLQSRNKEKLEELQSSVLAIVKRSNEMTKSGTETIDAANEQSTELDAMTGDFKTMSDLMVPLSKKKRSLSQSEQTITSWQVLFDEGINATIGRISSRVITILLALMIPFILSEAMRRALLQYMPDARQRRQMNIIRRIFLSIAITLIIILNLVSELGSLATFIGFVTAGLAVALQNIILSIVAHFFFFGRFGIQVGSRVSIGATTGDVIEMGIVRLYLMEMVEEKGQYRATGRIVSYPNSILFQSSAFFKQVPGANYRWHEATFTLAPETERALARTKLNEALDSIYKDSKTMLTMQRVAMEKSTRIKVKEPRPDGSLEKTTDSLNLIIRYPVDTENSDITDKNVIRQVGEIFERLPAVKLMDNEPTIVKTTKR